MAEDFLKKGVTWHVHSYLNLRYRKPVGSPVCTGRVLLTIGVHRRMIGHDLVFIFGDPKFSIFLTKEKFSSTGEEFSNISVIQLVYTSAAVLVVKILKLLEVVYSHCLELPDCPLL